MARSLNPNDSFREAPAAQLRWAQSVHTVLNGQVDVGRPTGSVDSTGNYNKFTQGNSNGNLIRVGANGTTDNAYAWGASNSPIIIYHGLVDSNNQPRIPIGVHVVNKDKSVDVYMPTAPNSQYAEVSPTDNSANVTLYFF